ncbi:MAG: hypothetical protein ACXWF2_08680, partial [Usitatibacter sp.]
MSVLRLAWSYLAARRLLTALHILMIAIGMGTMVMVTLFTAQTEERLQRDARPVDLVVGAKGSPLQLVLNTVYNLDVSPGNVSWKLLEQLRDDKRVKLAVPFSV